MPVTRLRFEANMTTYVLSQHGRARGIVLVAVLWMVAALSLIATGVVQVVRSEVRLVSLARQAAEAGALGDAAIQLVLQTLSATPEKPTRISVIETDYRGSAIRVEIRPNNGLVSISTAPASLLQSLYAVAGGLGAKAAEELANATVEVRSKKDAAGQAAGFEATEDLLSVPGFDYGLYAKLKNWVTADQTGSGLVNPMAAPEAILVVLANGNAASAAKLAAARNAGGVGVDTTALNAGYIDTTMTQRFRLEARVPLAEGSWFLISRTVDLNPGLQDGMPWRTLHTERAFEAAPTKSN